MFFVFILLACMGTVRINDIQRLATEKDLLELATILQKNKHSYLREEAALQLHHFPKEDWNQTARDITRNCIEQNAERCTIRGYCAYALGRIEDASAVGPIVSAMEDCDSESRYWMLLALEPLAEHSVLAKAQIAELQQDSDLFIRARARQSSVQ